MRFLRKFSFVQTRVTKLFAFYHFHKTQLHTHLKPPKANQTLKRYLDSNCPTKALSLFRVLLRKNLSIIDGYSLLFVLKACTQMSSSIEGKQLHALVMKLGFDHVIHLQTSLVNMYLVMKLGFDHVIHLQTSLVNMYSASCGIVDAHKMFDEMPEKNIICWTALISAYVENQKPNMALQLFRQMQMENVEPDQVTVTVALSACADLGALEMGEWIHTYVRRKKGLNTDLCLKNALINMYAKCGDIEAARRLFDSLQRKDVTTWTSMIVGHALHGQAEEALKLFSEMKETRESPKKKKKNNGCNGSASPIVPNDVTFIGVFMSCSHAGMVEEGKRQFRSMIEDYGLKPRDSHFGCMVDLFCRAGMLEEAYDFISKTPVRVNAVVWRTLLSACGLNGNVELGSRVRQKLLELEPSHVGDSVVLSNIYAAKGMWERKMVVRDRIMGRRRSPGCSSIEVGSGIFEFVAADDDHPLKSEIIEVLKHLVVNMKAYGYSTRLSCLEDY